MTTIMIHDEELTAGCGMARFYPTTFSFLELCGEYSLMSSCGW